jgi:hypothetical protein
LTFPQTLLSNLRQTRREVQALQAHAERLIAFSAEHWFTLGPALATVQLGWSLAAQGSRNHGIAQIEDGLAACREWGRKSGPVIFFPYRSTREWKRAASQGLATLTEALAATETNETRPYEELIR